MDNKNKAMLHAIIWEMAQNMLKQNNPCKIRKGLCIQARGKYPWCDSSLCCTACEHLTKTGCSIKSLACKLWLCWGNKDSRTRGFLAGLSSVAHICGLDMPMRSDWTHYKSEMPTINPKALPYQMVQLSDEEKAELHIKFWDRFNSELKMLNPCKFDEKGRCFVNRKSSHFLKPIADKRNGCCNGCHGNHLSPAGCTIKNLRCKLFLCQYVAEKDPWLQYYSLAFTSVSGRLGLDTQLYRVAPYMEEKQDEAKAG